MACHTWHTCHTYLEECATETEECSETHRPRFEVWYVSHLNGRMGEVMTFQEFLRRTRAHDTPEGDFVRDAREDRFLPVTFDSWEDLEYYLTKRRACGGAFDAARVVWRRYQRLQRRRNPAHISGHIDSA